MQKIGIVGYGRIGTALAVSLSRCGYSIQVVRRNQELTKTSPVQGKEFLITSLEKLALQAEVIFITTPDDIIASIVEKLQKTEMTCKAVLHVSGSLSSEILASLEGKGIITGSLHPLQSFPNVEQAVSNFPGSFFTYEGNPRLLPWITELVVSLGGILKILPSTEMKVIYHAGAVFVSNYMVGLASLGSECLKKAGFSDAEAIEALLPLMKGTLNNLMGMSPEKALTGPISRGDVGVITSHLQTLKQDLPDSLPAYCAMAEVLANISAQTKKITARQKLEMLKVIRGGVCDE